MGSSEGSGGVATILSAGLLALLVIVMFCTIDSTPPLSLLKMLCRCTVDHHHYQSFGTSHVNGLHSTHVYLFSILEYGHAWSKYHMFIFPCHMFVLSYDFPGSFWNGKYVEDNSGQERTKSGTLPVTDKDLASTYVLCCLSPTCP